VGRPDYAEHDGAGMFLVVRWCWLTGGCVEVGAAAVCGQGSSSYVVAVGREEGFRLRRSQCYPGDAPSASATLRKVGRKGKDAGRCTTTRRTETSTRAPSFNNRSRSVQT
jgi:hypothetical protein